MRGRDFFFSEIINHLLNKKNQIILQTELVSINLVYAVL